MPRLLPSAKGLCLNCLGFYSINTNVSISLHILADKIFWHSSSNPTYVLRRGSLSINFFRITDGKLSDRSHFNNA
ncbi:hypothetical protein GQ607_010499 [Colletotrichum asianum]|uniref:Uncharacterized protein n=1 Tax=Colletotrichum asianum TaxID=702518 RepID=A0A8H3ZQA9_9PEZI|nr:hypothetical protein GQ607_010499 [Colletotrichum asianum]